MHIGSPQHASVFSLGSTQFPLVSALNLEVQIDQLTKEREELRAEIRFLMSGKKREKFINADQMLLELKDDKELQAALESAKKDAEEELEALNNTPNTAPKKRKPAPDKFPAHLPREDIEVAIPPAFQARIKSGELFVNRQQSRRRLDASRSRRSQELALCGQFASRCAQCELDDAGS